MNKFTTEQSAKIRAYIQNQRSVLLTQPTPPVYPDITDSVQIIGPMHGDSVQDYSNVTLRWHRVPNATHYGVEVWFSNPFGSSYKTVETAFTTDTSYHCTNVLPHRYYYWKIKAINPHTTCSPISPKLKFRTGYGALAVNTLDIYHLDGAVFPNPNHENNFTVDINTLKATKGNLQVIGLDGKVFYSEDIRLQTGENQFNVENIYLPNGIFLVRVQTEDGSFWQEKLSIIK
jgi:hypothetical protein